MAIKLKNVNSKINEKIVNKFHKSLLIRNQKEARRTTITDVIAEAFVKHTEEWK